MSHPLLNVRRFYKIMAPTVNLQYDNNAMETEPYFDLGTYSRRINPGAGDCQKWFDRGLIWTYGFNHEEAVRCFERASREDPGAVMPLWGIAYSLGPNYNKPWEMFDDDERAANLERCRQVLADAKTKCIGGVEGRLIEALESRYSSGVEGTGEEKYAEWNAGYAKAMKEVYDECGKEDLDVCALYADSLMNLTPWALWDLRTGEPSPGSRTLEAKSVLEKAFDKPGGREHAGLLHLYIHLMEMSAKPEDAIPIADRLRGLVPDAGHLNHMPTHLDVLCGQWEQAITSNSQAIDADERYLKKAGALNFYSLYRSHDYHFRIYAAMFAGQYKVAMETVEMLEASLPEEVLRIESPPMADWLESFLSMRVHVFVRFGKWEELKKLRYPHDRQLYCVSTAMHHYGQGIASAMTGDLENANHEAGLFRYAADLVPESRTLFNNTAKDILKIAGCMLSGEVLYREGEVEVGLDCLKSAVEFSDKLPYDEPWGWMQPPRHALGALLMEQGRFEEALKLYKADLGLDDTLPRALRHPNNVWALHGLHECLEKTGQVEEASKIQEQLEELQKGTDVEVTSSCYCRRLRPQD